MRPFKAFLIWLAWVLAAAGLSVLLFGILWQTSASAGLSTLLGMAGGVLGMLQAIAYYDSREIA